MPEPKISYEKVDKKTQRGLVVRAPSWERLYINAALAVTDSLVALDRLEATAREHVSVQGKNQAELMEQWLSAVLSLVNDRKFLSRRIVFDSFDGRTIKATLHGDQHDRLRHGTVEPTTIATDPKLEVGDASAPEPVFFTKFFLNETPNVSAP
jgi:SHS2 domain-containing protein